MLAALVLALGGAALGVGCGEDPEEPGGTGGTGGTVDPGTGGAGGDPGDVPCEEATCVCGPSVMCRMGEFCVDDGPFKACRCDPNNDRCESGRFCDPASLKCVELPPPPTEFSACTTLGETTPEGLECLNANGVLTWLRLCDSSDDCALNGTYCQTEKDPQAFGVCWRNFCGLEADDGTFENGQVFGQCDARRGILDENTTDFGHCTIVEFSDGEVAGLCERTGTSDTTCKGRAFDPADDESCVGGSSCQDFIYRNDLACDPDDPLANPCPMGMSCDNGRCFHDGCDSDADCAEDGYCTSDGICAPLGGCLPECNAGTAGTDVEMFAGCNDGEACTPNSNLPASAPLRAGVCEPTEDPTGGTGGTGGSEDPGTGGTGGSEDPGTGGTGGSDEPGDGV